MQFHSSQETNKCVFAKMRTVTISKVANFYCAMQSFMKAKRNEYSNTSTTHTSLSFIQTLKEGCRISLAVVTLRYFQHPTQATLSLSPDRDKKKCQTLVNFREGKGIDCCDGVADSIRFKVSQAPSLSSHKSAVRCSFM